MQKKRWLRAPQLNDAEQAELQALLAEFKPSPLLLQLLFARQVIRPRPYTVPGPDGPERRPAHTPDEMKAAVAAYLSPEKAPLPDPLLLKGVAEAVERTERAIQAGEAIAVYGDFDCDGITSTTLLTQALRAFGATVHIQVPHRVNDGYGLNVGAMEKLAARNVKLVVTVDCGIGDVEEVRRGQELGMDLIVTDHHELPVDLPNCICINPRQESEAGEAFDGLAGVGVAYQLVRALVTRMGKPRELRNNDLLELVAIGTVADVASLKGINRTLVSLGIQALRKTRRLGLLALMKSGGIAPETVDAEDIAFVIGPRLNAAGRIDDAKSAYGLLLTEKPEQAEELAQKLESDNRSRRAMTEAATKEAKRRVAELGEELPYVLVLRDKEWSPGIIGLVASRLVDEFNRPAIVMQESEETSRGSARSVKGFHMRNALADIAEAVEEVFVDFGGHEGAAGFTLRNEFLEEFETFIQDVAEQQLDGRPMQPEITADAEIELSAATLETCAEVGRMEPFGQGNAMPVFATKALRVVDSRTVGGEGQHLAIRVAPDGAPPNGSVEAMLFKRGDLQGEMAKRPKIDLLYTLEKRCWQGDTTVRLIVKDLRPGKE